MAWWWRRQADHTVLEEGMTIVIEFFQRIGQDPEQEKYFLLEDGGVVTKDGWKTFAPMSTELIELDYR